MNENNKRLAKNSLIMYVQVILDIVIGFVAVRILLKTLGSSDYGTYNVVGGFVATMALISMPMVSGMQRFFAFDLGRKDYQQLTRDFNTTNIIYLFFGVLSILLLETIGLWFLNNHMTFEDGRMDVVNWVYQLSVFAFFFQVIAHPYNALILAHENIFMFSLFNVLSKAGNLLIAIVLPFVPYDHLLVYAILTFIYAVLMRVLPQIYCYRKYEESHFHFYWDKKFFKSILSYSIFNSIGTLAGLGRTQGVNIILNMFYGPVVNAARAVSSQLQKLVHSLYTNIGTPARPQITKYYAQGKMEDMWNLVERSTKVMFYICIVVAIPLCLESEYVLTLWLGEYPEYSPIFLRLSLILSVFSSTYLVNCTLQAANKIKREQIYQATITLMTLPLGYLALKLGYGPVSPFIIAAALQLIASIVSVFIVQYELKKNMTFFFIILVRLYLASILSVAAPLGVLLIMPSSFLRLVIVTFVSIISVTFMMYFICLNNEERQWAKVLVKKVTDKFIHRIYKR